MLSKSKFVMIAVSIGLWLGSSSVFAAGPFYNCHADSTFFNVRVAKDIMGNDACVWTVRTGEEPVQGYVPHVAIFPQQAFELSKKKATIENCTPTTLDAIDMEWVGPTLNCEFVPAGDRKKKILLKTDIEVKGAVQQQLVNNKWVPVDVDCPAKNSIDCRVGPVEN